VDSGQARLIDHLDSNHAYLEFTSGFVPAETFDRLRIAQSLKKSPKDQVLLLEDTRVARDKLLHHAWALQRSLSGDSREESNFIQENLFLPWQDLEVLAKSREPFADQVSHILEMRKAIHQLKVIALKRGEGPAWVEAQMRWASQFDPLLSILILPAYHAMSSVPNESIARLQDTALRQGYTLFFGPFPVDPLAGRPEFLALRWVQDSPASAKLRPQWGVLSEDGFFNTIPQVLQRVTAALGLYTLPTSAYHNEFRFYARLVSKMHREFLDGSNGNALPLLEAAQVTAQKYFFAMNPVSFYKWRALAAEPNPTKPKPEAGSKTAEALWPQERRKARWLECDFPLWETLPQDLCLAFADQSGREGIFDGQDQWGYLDENQSFAQYPADLEKNFRLLGLTAIPSGTPFAAMDKYVRHFNRAYQLASGDTLAYPSASMSQIIEDLGVAFGVAQENRIPISFERFRRMTQDALTLFWDSFPELLAFRYSHLPNPTEEKVGLLFTAHQELIAKERKTLKAVAKALDRDPKQVLDQFTELAVKNVKVQMAEGEPDKTSLRTQYTLRLLLGTLSPRDLEGLVEPMKQLAGESAKQGRGRDCYNWLTSADMVLRPLGKRVGREEFQQALELARLNQRGPSPEAAPASVDAAIPKDL
jgi:hypothetical protein